MFFNNKISIRQFQTLFILYAVGTGVIILPRTIAQFAAQDGWMLIIGGVIIALFCSYIINSLSSLFPNFSFIEYSGFIISTPVGMVLSLIFSLKLIFTSAMELKIFGEICNQTILNTTPPYVIYIFLLSTCVFLVLKGNEIIGRLSEILVVIVLIPILIVFISALFTTDFTNLLPIGKTHVLQLVRGSFFTSFAFRGIEFALFVYPLLGNTKGMRKEMSWSIISVGLFMLFISVITLANFSSNDVTKQLWPILQMMDSIELPGAFIERQDALVMSIWIISVFMSLSIGIFISAHIIEKLFKKTNTNYYVIPVTFLIFIIALIPQDIVQTYNWLDNCEFVLGSCYIFIIPILLLILAKVRKLGEKCD